MTMSKFLIIEIPLLIVFVIASYVGLKYKFKNKRG